MIKSINRTRTIDPDEKLDDELQLVIVSPPF